MMQIQYYRGMLVQENDEKMKTTSTNYAVLRKGANYRKFNNPRILQNVKMWKNVIKLLKSHIHI